MTSEKRAIYFLCLNALRFVPYAYGMLRTYAELDPVIQDQYSWKEPLIDIDPVETIAAGITEPAVLLASCYVWNHNQQMAIARQVKARYPACLVVCGGPHVPERPGDYYRCFPQADVLVHGEGLVPFARFFG